MRTMPDLPPARSVPVCTAHASLSHFTLMSNYPDNRQHLTSTVSFSVSALVQTETCQAAPLKTRYSHESILQTPSKKSLQCKGEYWQLGQRQRTLRKMVHVRIRRSSNSLTRSWENKEKRTNMQVRADLWTGLGIYSHVKNEVEEFERKIGHQMKREGRACN
ncbi:hypothetical protein SKAU_G00020190 [Synaphobranchus kaupii]|uniref:Uncharacterized protein n=1 Tax=Synaphobranchus kaupii TaxID=118154 RepID=A0A9Q1GBN0_SYNKA|nr:hypothetical protein SKAU_G00020190 [Synaphobranchus kaupii]